MKTFVDMDAGGPYIATDECTESVERLHNRDRCDPSPAYRDGVTSLNAASFCKTIRIAVLSREPSCPAG
ncbi:hypothetical protein [Allorhizocola rhizosphaerae]|uniref:hypothetical protein n=1 Tax=Allorhizocola rhizosphaerae TaxID=1872709 RepID=UPI000E3CD2B6|nr:hypothetical protein [Allorhizocola rhizosphaerae]